MKNTTNERSEKITDFGEKIGFAMKDFYAMRNGLNPDEVNPRCRKRYIWKNIDIAKQKEAGVPEALIYFKRTVRAELSNTARYNGFTTAADSEAEYINAVEQIRDAAEGAKTLEDAFDVLDVVHRFAKFVRESADSLVRNWMLIGYEPDFEDAVNASFSTYGFYKPRRAGKRNRKPAYIGFTRGVVRKNFSYRNGGDVSGNDYLTIIGVRGGEFGNWESNAERQRNLNYAYDAFCNLATAMSIEVGKTSLGQLLAIAFGSRGRGGAVAHYEPLLNVINLTRKKGAGALAHEWFHALDHYIRTLSVHTYPDVKYAYEEVRREIENSQNYVEISRELDASYSHRGHDYWSSMDEMFARAGASWIFDLLSKRDITDDFLVSPEFYTDGKLPDGLRLVTYPIGEERENISAKFKNLINEMKKAELF